jgi:hypothetical protein
MSLQETPSRAGRSATKFSPSNVQKIKDFVAQGIKREEIARVLDVTVGSLQVTCSRLGISLRTPKMFERRTRVVSRPYIPNHPPMVGHMRSEPQRAGFQIILKRNGLVQRATDLPLMGSDIARVGFEAAVQNLGMAQLMAVAVTTAIKRDLIDEILRAPTQLACATGPFQCGHVPNRTHGLR